MVMNMFLGHNCFMEALATRIKSIRKMRGFTQQQIADQLNVDQGHLSRLERGEKGATIELLHRLAKILDTPLSYLLGESNIDQHPKSTPPPPGLKMLQDDTALTETLKITDEEWLALTSILLPGEADKDGYVQLLYTIRTITK